MFSQIGGNERSAGRDQEENEDMVEGDRQGVGEG